MFKKTEGISLIEYGKAIVKAELLQAEVDRLRAQVDRLQEALVASTAPKAYDQMQADKAGALELQPTEVELKRIEQQREEEAFTRNFIDGLEKPIFQDADDLISSLGRLVGVSVSDTPIQPNNQES